MKVIILKPGKYSDYSNPAHTGTQLLDVGDILTGPDWYCDRLKELDMAEDVEVVEKEIEQEPETDPGSGQGNGEDGPTVNANKAALKLAEEAGIDLTGVEGSGPGGRIIKPDVEQLIEAAQTG